MSNNINVDTAKVLEIATTVSKTFDDLKTKIDDIAKKRDLINDYWSATEADYFISELAKIDTLFTKFSKQYDKFSDSLKNITSSYDDQEKKLLDALDSANNANSANSANSDSSANSDNSDNSSEDNGDKKD